MQSLLNVLRTRYFWYGIGFLLIVTLTLVVGVWLGWSMVTRLLTIIGLLVLCLAFIVVEFVRASRNAQKIEQSIKMQADEQRRGSRPDRRAEIEELQERLENAIGTLKHSNLGQGRRSQDALHALPWYMFIGPPAAGKTTAIKNSGLNFPVGTDGIRGVGGTRNCDWFFSDQAILLDTAGRYMTEKEDEEEWHAFLDMLKDHRSSRPINGVLVGISIDELVDAAPDEIEWHANSIRRRISELVERLEVRFPVYVVFTKCDLLQGFVEFFGDMTRKERQQIWGSTITEEQRTQGDARSVFEDEFDVLYQSLVDARCERLSRSMKREERRRVFVFPLEFASAKENLSLFIDQLFQENPYQENPEFRGFYFTSGTQEGAPIDRVIQSISEQFDFSMRVNGGGEPEMETKSYFIKDLFTETIIPDQYLVEQTFRSVRRGRLMRWGVGAVCAIVLGLFVVFSGQAVVRSEMRLGTVESVAKEAAAVRWDGRSSIENLATLDRLGDEVSNLEEHQDNPPFLSWGLYRGAAVLGPARDVFYAKMRPLVRAQFQKIEQQLAGADTISRSLARDQRVSLRKNLRAYLLLSEEAQRLRDSEERSFLKSYLTTVATGRTGRLVTPRFRDRSGQVEAQMARVVEGIGRQRVPGFEGRSALIRNVRRLIYRKPTIDILYSEIKRQGMRTLQPVRLAAILQESGGRQLFDSQPEVSGFFTKRGWNGFVKEKIEKESQDPAKGDWVLGEQPDRLSTSFQNSDAVARQLRDRYFREYASAWNRFLGKITYSSFRGLRGTARALNQIGDPYNSPLLYILARASAETTFAHSVADEAKTKVQAEVQRHAEAKVRQNTRSNPELGKEAGNGSTGLHPVPRRFKGLHRLNAEKAVSGGAAPPLTRSLEALGRTGAVLDGLVGTPAKVTDVAAKVLNGSGEIRTALRTVRTSLDQIDPAARRNLFDDAVLRAWDAILSGAERHLNDRWRTEVYRSYQEHIDGRYPLVSSQQDVSLGDFRQFFQPKTGTVATFETQRLAPFFHDGGRTAKTWEGRGLHLSSSAKRFLEDRDRIGNVLFSGGGLHLQFTLTPEVPKRTDDAPAASQVFIRVHGTPQKYQMGYQPTTTFTWPGERGGRLLLTTRAGELGPKRFEGAWAWFRMLEAADVEPLDQTTYRLRWVFKQEGQYSVVTRYNLRSEKPAYLFTSPRSFFRIRVPKSLN